MTHMKKLCRAVKYLFVQKKKLSIARVQRTTTVIVAAAVVAVGARGHLVFILFICVRVRSGSSLDFVLMPVSTRTR